MLKLKPGSPNLREQPSGAGEKKYDDVLKSITTIYNVLAAEVNSDISDIYAGSLFLGDKNTNAH